MEQKQFLKQKDFVLLVFAKLISLLGSNMLQFALSLYVLAMTGSATVFASMLSIVIIPRIFLAPIAGVFGDWFDRKKSIVLLNFLNVIILGGYTALFMYFKGLTLPLIYALVILLEVTEIFFGAAMSGIMPSIIAKEQLMQANSYNSLVLNIGLLLAPVIAATLYSTFGLKILLIASASGFIISAIAELFIFVPQNNTRPEKITIKAFKTDFAFGIKAIFNNRSLTTIIGLGTILNFVMAPLFNIGIIFVIKELLKASDFHFGLFQSIFASSMIIAPIISVKFFSKAKVGKTCYNSFMISAVFIFLLALIPSKFVLAMFSSYSIPLILLLLIVFPIGVSITIANIVVGTLFTQTTPISLIGRVGSTSELLLTICIPLGQMFFGFLYDKISASLVILLSAIIFIIALFSFKNGLLSTNSYKEEQIVGVAVGEL